MGVSNGQTANQTTFNDAFMSRNSNTDTTGVVTLNNTSDADSGAEILNLQQSLNELFDADGTAGQDDSTRKTYSSTVYVANGDDRKTAIGKLDAALAVVAAAGGGGGGGGIDFEFFKQADAPLESIVSNSECFEFEDAVSQYLYASIAIPASYVAGNPIALIGDFFTSVTSGTVLFKTVATLIRVGTDANTSTTNQRTSTNAAITVNGSTNVATAFSCDLTDSGGQINSVAVAPGDRIKFRIERDTSTDTAAASAFLYKKGYEVTIS